MSVTLTENAQKKLRTLLEAKQAEDGFLRVYVERGGCGGWTYGMALDREQGEADTEFKVDDVKVVIDEESLPLLEGIHIDYKEALMGGGFTVSNPNASHSCACGSSFRTAKQKGEPKKCSTTS